MIKNIIFDLGKVLVDYNWQSYLQSFHFDSTTYQAVANAIFLNEDWVLGDMGEATKETWLSYFIDNAPSYEKEIRRVYDTLEECICRFPYTEQWIELYRKKGYKLYYLSNYSEGLYEKTKDILSFIDDFDGGIFSYREKCIKPDPHIYQCLIDRYHIIPKESVFFDDRPENVDAAMKFGLNGIVFTESVADKELKSKR